MAFFCVYFKALNCYQKLSPPGAMDLPADKAGANRLYCGLPVDLPTTTHLPALRFVIEWRMKSVQRLPGPGLCLAVPGRLYLHELPRGVVGAGREESFDSDRNKRRKVFQL